MPNFKGELNPGEGMGGRWQIGQYVTHDGRRLTNRNQAGELKDLPEQMPSDAVLPEKVRELLDAYLSADSDFQLAKDEKAAYDSDNALQRAQAKDAQRVVDAATAGKSEKDFRKIAQESPNEAELTVNRRVAAAKLEAAKAPLIEARKALLTALNDEAYQAEAKQTAEQRLAEAEELHKEAEAAYQRAKGALDQAQRDRHNVYVHWADEPYPGMRKGGY